MAVSRASSGAQDLHGPKAGLRGRINPFTIAACGGNWSMPRASLLR
jgi:hypothetical protein